MIKKKKNKLVSNFRKPKLIQFIFYPHPTYKIVYCFWNPRLSSHLHSYIYSAKRYKVTRLAVGAMLGPCLGNITTLFFPFTTFQHFCSYIMLYKCLNNNLHKHYDYFFTTNLVYINNVTCY